jgi:phage shock protein PspC (stress-responsive transcriptional regulator)
MNNRLYRSNSEAVLGGVAAGIARHLNVDPNVVRLGFVIGTFFTHGALLLVYLALWAVLPSPGSTGTDVGSVVRENVNEVAARLGMHPPTAAPRVETPRAEASTVDATTTPSTAAPQTWHGGPALVRGLIITGLVFAAFRFGLFVWAMAGPHHYGGSFIWPLVLVLGVMWWCRRRRAA